MVFILQHHRHKLLDLTDLIQSNLFNLLYLIYRPTQSTTHTPTYLLIYLAKSYKYCYIHDVAAS
jgi:hypothetical protein